MSKRLFPEMVFVRATSEYLISQTAMRPGRQTWQGNKMTRKTQESCRKSLVQIDRGLTLD